jgi:hypothetical protein
MGSDMRKVFAAFNMMAEKGIIENYAIGGAMAISLHEQPAMTEDIDIFIAYKKGTLISMSPLFDFMRSLGATEENGDHLRFAGWLIHILSPKSPSLVEEALDNAESYDAGQGVTTRVFKLEYLAAIALETGREKDKLRVRMLADRKALDTREFAAIIKHYRLEKRYAEWTR